MITSFADACCLLSRSVEFTPESFRSRRTCLIACLLLFSAAARVDAAALTLQWDPPADGVTTGYVVWHGKSAGSYTSWTDVGLVSVYKIEGLADGTPYCFAVQAYSASGETSGFSAPVCTTTPTSSSGGTTPPPEPPPDETSDPNGASEIVLYASSATNIRGNWAKATSSGAAGGSAMRSVDQGWSAANAPLASPAHAFDLRFDALADTPYRIWLRLRATSNSKWNDSAWVQFSGALVNGDPGYRIGTTSALLVNLEQCSTCGVSGWGWVNSAYWLRQATRITFAESGTKTIRIQTREDGVEIDQVVLSAERFFSGRPGATKNDTRILTSTAAPAPVPSPVGTPYSGTPKVLPGTIKAAYFDNGGAGVAYVDSTAGNAGGVFRQTDVDLVTAAIGGYLISSTTPGEWVSYTVNVRSAGTYYVKLKAASLLGGSIQVSLDGAGNVARSFTIPKTGGLQTIKPVLLPMTLAAGIQRVTVRFVTGNVNLYSIVVSDP
jgi:hypothetical protein